MKMLPVLFFATVIPLSLLLWLANLLVVGGDETAGANWLYERKVSKNESCWSGDNKGDNGDLLNSPAD